MCTVPLLQKISYYYDDVCSVLDQSRLVAGYVSLYSQARLDTLDSLDRMAEEKNKLILSKVAFQKLS